VEEREEKKGKRASVLLVIGSSMRMIHCLWIRSLTLACSGRGRRLLTSLAVGWLAELVSLLLEQLQQEPAN
jgi:hypothetical protein